MTKKNDLDWMPIPNPQPTIPRMKWPDWVFCGTFEGHDVVTPGRWTRVVEADDEIARLRIALDAIKDSDNLEFIHVIAETALEK